MRNCTHYIYAPCLHPQASKARGRQPSQRRAPTAEPAAAEPPGALPKDLHAAELDGPPGKPSSLEASPPSNSEDSYSPGGTAENVLAVGGQSLALPELNSRWDEEARLASLRELRVVGQGPDPRFDSIVRWVQAGPARARRSSTPARAGGLFLRPPVALRSYRFAT